MRQGGTITIGATKVSLPPGRGRSRQGDFVAISISDEGPGISAEVQARMYEPFYTTKGAGAGAGLGLSISNMIAQQSGGWLICKSAVDAGTTFTLYLPLVDAPVSDLPNEQPALPLGRETVLVVEDDPMVGEFEALLLRNLGYTVMRAEDSVEAERTIATSGAIDLVLTDLRMPRMDGIDRADRGQSSGRESDPHLRKRAA